MCSVHRPLRLEGKMTDTIRDTVTVWAYGKQKELRLYQASNTLNANSYYRIAREKFQIVLHCTAANNPASTAINTWSCRWTHPQAGKNPSRASAHFVVEREDQREDDSQTYTDVVQVVDRLDWQTVHSSLYQNSIGIEIVNKCHLRRIDGSGYCSYEEVNQLPAADNHPNGYYQMAPPRIGNCAEWLYQAYQQGQYEALILLLRYLCTQFPIPRVFLGRDAQSNLGCHWPITPAQRNFRGILSHCNIHQSKPCGGPALHRNRLYRGITDEWWLPVNVDGSERGYYTGPFSANRNFFYGNGSPHGSREDGTPILSTSLSKADIDALQETKSYFDLDAGVDSYFDHVEGNQGGHFPIGRYSCFHGGVHFFPPEGNPRVYAAASGRIVAARLGTIPELEDTQNQFGSPRFVLIRHAVYIQTHRVQVGASTELRIDYAIQPYIVFSLYMHLAPLPVDGENGPIDYDHSEFDNHSEIPEWYKQWRNANETEEISQGQVFNPDIKVMAGDHLGSCGRWYRQPRCLHFEIISGEDEEIDMPLPPLFSDSGEQTCVTEDSDRFYAPSFQSQEGRECNAASQQRQYNQLRNHVCHHRNEWALYESDLVGLRDHLGVDVFRPIYENIERVVWYHRARRVWANVRSTNALAEELLHNLPGDGRVWHYHPITFMGSVNNQLRELQGDFAGGHTGQAGSATGPGQTAVPEVPLTRVGCNSLETGPFAFSV